MVLSVADMLRRERNQRYALALQKKVEAMPLSRIKDYVTKVESFDGRSFYEKLFLEIVGQAPDREIYSPAKKRLENEID